jgi:hypothetical protein
MEDAIKIFLWNLHGTYCIFSIHRAWRDSVMGLRIDRKLWFNQIDPKLLPLHEHIFKCFRVSFYDLHEKMGP